MSRYDTVTYLLHLKVSYLTSKKVHLKVSYLTSKYANIDLDS